MVVITRDMIKQFQILMEASDNRLKIAFENMHQGYPTETMKRFLNAREGNVSKAHKMLVDCLDWRIHNNIDEILSKPTITKKFHVPGLSGYTKNGQPVFAVGAGLSTYDKASDLHQGYPTETMMRFLNAREGNVCKAHKMVVDNPHWRIQNEIDELLSKPTISKEFYVPGLSGYTKNGQPVVAVGAGLSTYDKASVPLVESIGRIFKKYKFGEGSWLLQLWACTPSNSEDIGYNLMLTDQTFISTQDERLMDYRRCYLENRCRFVGKVISVGNWLAGRAAQTGMADHRTTHHECNHEDQHSANIGDMGQLVLPVFYGQDAGNELVGIIELVTSVPKESHVEDFARLHNLLKDEGLKSSYMGKMIKVKYNRNLIKFTLPLSAKCTDLHREVKRRFPELEYQKFRVKYGDIEGNGVPISSDDELRVCMAESSLKGWQVIKMCVL